MAKAFIAAALLAVALIGAVVVPAALTRGTFGFDAWPEAQATRTQDEAVVIHQPSPAQADTRSQRRPGVGRGHRATPEAPAARTQSLPRSVVHVGSRQQSGGGAEPDAPEAPTAPEDEPEALPVPDVPAAPGEDLADAAPEAPVVAPEVEARPVVEAPPATPTVVGVLPLPVWDRGRLPGWVPPGHRDDTK